ncbi:Retrovirus-related Pol polyprotein from transposon 17.6 [Lucilia cuprina]|nr:Retrovirus-related Pol polyprotein from transposon 17.6 [Lucilia cuprina]
MFIERYNWKTRLTTRLIVQHAIDSYFANQTTQQKHQETSLNINPDHCTLRCADSVAVIVLLTRRPTCFNRKAAFTPKVPFISGGIPMGNGDHCQENRVPKIGLCQVGVQINENEGFEDAGAIFAHWYRPVPCASTLLDSHVVRQPHYYGSVESATAPRDVTGGPKHDPSIMPNSGTYLDKEGKLNRHLLYMISFIHNHSTQHTTHSSDTFIEKKIYDTFILYHIQIDTNSFPTLSPTVTPLTEPYPEILTIINAITTTWIPKEPQPTDQPGHSPAGNWPPVVPDYAVLWTKPSGRLKHQFFNPVRLEGIGPSLYSRDCNNTKAEVFAKLYNRQWNVEDRSRKSEGEKYQNPQEMSKAFQAQPAAIQFFEDLKKKSLSYDMAPTSPSGFTSNVTLVIMVLVLRCISSKVMRRNIHSILLTKLNNCQKNYSVTEKECLAAVGGRQKVRGRMFEMMPFTIVTDYASLKWFNIARWSLQLQALDFEIMHRKGSENVVADMLSRLPDHEHVEELNMEEIFDFETAEFECEEYLDLIKHVQENSHELPDLKVDDGKVSFERKTIRAYLKDDHRDWDLYLSEIECTLRTAVHSATGFTPGAEYKLSRKLESLTDHQIVEVDRNDKLEIIRQQIKINLQKAYERSAKRYNQRARVVTFVPGQKKFLKCRVVRPVGNNMYELETLQGKTLGVYHSNKIKLHLKGKRNHKVRILKNTNCFTVYTSLKTSRNPFFSKGLKRSMANTGQLHRTYVKKANHPVCTTDNDPVTRNKFILIPMGLPLQFSFSKQGKKLEESSCLGNCREESRKCEICPPLPVLNQMGGVTANLETQIPAEPMDDTYPCRGQVGFGSLERKFCGSIRDKVGRADTEDDIYLCRGNVVNVVQIIEENGLIAGSDYVCETTVNLPEVSSCQFKSETSPYNRFVNTKMAPKECDSQNNFVRSAEMFQNYKGNMGINSRHINGNITFAPSNFTISSCYTVLISLSYKLRYTAGVSLYQDNIHIQNSDKVGGEGRYRGRHLSLRGKRAIRSFGEKGLEPPEIRAEMFKTIKGNMYKHRHILNKNVVYEKKLTVFNDYRILLPGINRCSSKKRNIVSIASRYKLSIRALVVSEISVIVVVHIRDDNIYDRECLAQRTSKQFEESVKQLVQQGVTHSYSRLKDRWPTLDINHVEDIVFRFRMTAKPIWCIMEGRENRFDCVLFAMTPLDLAEIDKMTLRKISEKNYWQKVYRCGSFSVEELRMRDFRSTAISSKQIPKDKLMSCIEVQGNSSVKKLVHEVAARSARECQQFHSKANQLVCWNCRQNRHMFMIAQQKKESIFCYPMRGEILMTRSKKKFNKFLPKQKTFIHSEERQKTYDPSEIRILTPKSPHRRPAISRRIKMLRRKIRQKRKRKNLLSPDHMLTFSIGNAICNAFCDTGASVSILGKGCRELVMKPTSVWGRFFKNMIHSLLKIVQEIVSTKKLTKIASHYKIGFALDARKLNKLTVKNAYPLQNIDVLPQSNRRNLNSLVLYQFRVMPFGLLQRGAKDFCRLMGQSNSTKAERKRLRLLRQPPDHFRSFQKHLELLKRKLHSDGLTSRCSFTPVNTMRRPALSKLLPILWVTAPVAMHSTPKSYSSSRAFGSKSTATTILHKMGRHHHPAEKTVSGAPGSRGYQILSLPARTFRSFKINYYQLALQIEPDWWLQQHKNIQQKYTRRTNIEQPPPHERHFGHILNTSSTGQHAYKNIEQSILTNYPKIKPEKSKETTNEQ